MLPPEVSTTALPLICRSVMLPPDVFALRFPTNSTIEIEPPDVFTSTVPSTADTSMEPPDVRRRGWSPWDPDFEVDRKAASPAAIGLLAGDPHLARRFLELELVALLEIVRRRGDDDADAGLVAPGDRDASRLGVHDQLAAGGKGQALLDPASRGGGKGQQKDEDGKPDQSHRATVSCHDRLHRLSFEANGTRDGGPVVPGGRRDARPNP